MRSLFVVVRVVRALMLREMKTRFGAYKLGYFWALMEPVFWISLFATASLMSGATTRNGVHIIPFLMGGFMPMLLFMDASQAGMYAISGNQALLVYPAIRPLDLVLSRLVLELATSSFVFLLMVGGVALWYGNIRIDDGLTMALVLPLVAALGAAWGLVACGLMTIVPSMANVMAYTTRPIFWISGAFFSTNELPRQAREILLWNPVLHCVELMRNGWFTNYEVRYVSFGYPFVCLIVLLFFGLALERVVVRQMAH